MATRAAPGKAAGGGKAVVSAPCCPEWNEHVTGFNNPYSKYNQPRHAIMVFGFGRSDVNARPPWYTSKHSRQRHGSCGSSCHRTPPPDAPSSDRIDYVIIRNTNSYHSALADTFSTHEGRVWRIDARRPCGIERELCVANGLEIKTKRVVQVFSQADRANLQRRDAAEMDESKDGYEVAGSGPVTGVTQVAGDFVAALPPTIFASD